MELLRTELDSIFASREKWSAKLQEEIDRVVALLAKVVGNSGPLPISTVGSARLRHRSMGYPQGADRYDGYVEWIELTCRDHVVSSANYDSKGRLSFRDRTASRNESVEAARALPQLIENLIGQLKAENAEQEQACEALRALIPAPADAPANLHIGYVLTDKGDILVQVPEDNQHGFSLCSDDQTWPGGFGIAQSWEALKDDDPRITADDHENMDWILDQNR
jgi:hypothetical protein